MPRGRLVPFVLRTSGLNASSEQGSDSAPIQTIAFTAINLQSPSTEPEFEQLDVSTIGLQEAVQKVTKLLSSRINSILLSFVF